MIVDMLWRRADRHGADLVQYLPGRAGKTLATISWDPQYSDGWRRYAWTVLERPHGALGTLTVIGSPEVEIALVQGKESMAPQLRMEIVRLQRADYVPQHGEPVRLGELLPHDLPVVVPAAIRPDDPGSFSLLPSPALPSSDLAHVRFLPDGAVVTHAGADWEVLITVDPRRSAAFALEVTAHPMPSSVIQARSVFRMRIARRGEVTVVYRQKSTRYPVRPGSGLTAEDSAKVDLDVGTVPAGLPVPLSGITLDMAGRYEIPPRVDFYPAFETAIASIPLTFASTLVPLAGSLAGIPALVWLGTLYNLGAAVYAMETGQDFVGTSLTHDEIVLTGIFALVGAALDHGLDALRVAYDLEVALFGSAKIVRLNPGVWEGLARLFVSRVSPIVREVVKGLDDEALMEVMTAAGKVLDDGALASVKLLATRLNELLVPLLADVAHLGSIPLPLYRQAMRTVDIAQAKTYSALPIAERILLAERYAEAIALQDPALLRLAEISAELDEEYTELVRDAVLTQMFEPGMNGFRVTWLDNSPYARALGLGFEAYRGSRESSLDVLEWAYAQSSNSRYYPMLVAEFGPRFREMFRPYVLVRRYRVDEATAAMYRPWAGTFDTYEKLRGLLEGLGMGTVLQVDHILEQRFAHYFEGLVGIRTDQFTSLMVPYNAICAQGFAAHGVTTFLYTHTLKTSRLRRLIPYGQEGKFTTQEIYNAYVLVYVHEFGLGYNAFNGGLDDVFREFHAAVRADALEHTDPFSDVRLAHAVLNPTLDTSRRTPYQLLDSIMDAQARP